MLSCCTINSFTFGLTGLVKRLETPVVNIKDRLLDLMFAGYQPHCAEGVYLNPTLRITLITVDFM